MLDALNQPSWANVEDDTEVKSSSLTGVVFCTYAYFKSDISSLH